MLATRRIDFGLVVTGVVGELRAGQDVEVIVDGVAARVTFGAHCCSEDDEIFGDAYDPY